MAIREFPDYERLGSVTLVPGGRPVARYGFAVGSVALALIVTYFVKPLREQPPTLLFFTAVTLRKRTT